MGTLIRLVGSDSMWVSLKSVLDPAGGEYFIVLGT